MSLEREADAAGGEVVVLLGNHELMAFYGDWRYTAPAAIASYGGAAARRAALAPDGKYGRWLRKRPALVAIDGTIFVHGGVVPELTQLGARGMRQRVRQEIARVDAARQWALETRALSEDADLDKLLALKPPALVGYAGWLIANRDGPFWNRGFDTASDAVLDPQLDRTLPALHAKRFVVGHSVQLGGEFRCRSHGRVWLIDTGMLGPPIFPGGRPLALELAGQTLTAIDASGARKPLPADCGTPPSSP
jgi:hypothetical protein